MFYQFSDLLFIHIILLLFIILLFINVTPQAHTFISILLIITLFILLLLYDLTFFGLILLAAELHVVYIVFCLFLMWHGSDSTLILNLKSSDMLISSRIILILVILFIYMNLIVTNIAINYFMVDSYIITLFISQSTELYNTTGVSLNVLGVLVQLYLSVNSLEFLLINCYILLTLFIYHLIMTIQRIYFSRLRMNSILYLQGSVKFNIKINKQHTTEIALLRVASIHNKGFNFKCYKNNHV